MKAVYVAFAYGLTLVLTATHAPLMHAGSTVYTTKSHVKQ